MTPSNGIPMSLSEFGQLESFPKTDLEYVSSITDYYNQLKSPYITAQQSIRQRLQVENDRLRSYHSEILLSGGQKRRIAPFKHRGGNSLLEISEMESGLNWATAKIMELDREMENKIRLFAERYGASQPFQNASGEEVVQYRNTENTLAAIA
ncbi:MAG: hypothetical protein H0X41_03940 [Chitinophagaceae bacterium]|nr:hypothetical protein [Chitinophagaceae bacterium]